MDISSADGRLAEWRRRDRRGGERQMWNTLRDELREMAWLASLIGGLSAVGWAWPWCSPLLEYSLAKNRALEETP